MLFNSSKTLESKNDYFIPFISEKTEVQRGLAIFQSYLAGQKKN